MKIIIVFTFIVLIVNLSAQNAELSTVNDIQYNIDLIRFYIDRNEYDTALEYIDKTIDEAAKKDSLFYYKGYIYKQKEDWRQAAKFLAESIICTKEEEIVTSRMLEFEEIIQEVSPLSAFDLVSYSVTESETSQKQIGFLNILAELYESNQLYSEANDVYNTILNEIDDSNASEYKLKIAANRIFQKDFEVALTILKPLVEECDSLIIENVHFLSYVANISMKNVEEAKSSLLFLYLNYPENPNREEILMGLAEIFELQESYMMSWFMLNELFKISNNARKYKLLNDIERIKHKICVEDFHEDPFKNFQPVFEIETVEPPENKIE